MSDHDMVFLGDNPVVKGEMRVTCSCGWTEKCNTSYQWNYTAAARELRNRWDKHAYTDLERCVMHELSCGCDG